MFRALFAGSIIYFFGLFCVILICIKDQELPDLSVMVIFTPAFYLIYKGICRVFLNNKNSRKIYLRINLFSKILLSVIVPIFLFVMLSILSIILQFSDNLFLFIFYFYCVGVFIFLHAIWRKPKSDNIDNNSDKPSFRL